MAQWMYSVHRQSSRKPRFDQIRSHFMDEKLQFVLQSDLNAKFKISSVKYKDLFVLWGQMNGLHLCDFNSTTI